MNKNDTQKILQPPKQKKAYSPKTVDYVLTKSHLRTIVTKASKIKVIEDYIKNSIAPEWGSYYHVQNLNGNTLVISACNSSVAQMIRLNSMDWLYSLRQAHWSQLTRLEVKVTNEEPERQKSETIKVKRIVENKTANEMQRMANSMPEDLQQAWLKLTDTLKHNSD